MDLVAQQADNDDLWAIPCKFLEHRVAKEDLDPFFTESGKHPGSRGFTHMISRACIPR
ncbi:MAG: hypothetical protein C7B47_10970 [Sulfobacillus thermosulfidooxidans]|uniref:Mrr-like domain-containing protein n=1 Tax=Sulfobacillus thermosulfidooxidans TaxID=28034 RepID=A0A2T2WVQ2_SULTH|nr:MAG: hypothetical protein C7B47_10970 [Sulfobacillus thermosulfidooxidans]